AYTTGYESLFINPANLYIREKDYKIQIASAMFGTRFSSPLRYNGNGNYLDGYFDQTDFFDPSDSVPLNEQERESFIAHNYQDHFTRSQHISSGELHLFGAHWAGTKRSYALSLRSRYSNRYDVGRNYYDPLPVRAGNHDEYNRTLNHQFQSFYELSFGYAESFTFLNGLFPQLSQFIIGVAPKLIASGAYFDAEYTNKSLRKDEQLNYQNTREFQLQGSGPFSEIARQFRLNPDPGPGATSTYSRNDLFSITGYGLGIDVGLTYLITLGDDLSVVQDHETATRKSLRVSLSVTDIGFVTYKDDPVVYSFDKTREEDEFPDESLSDRIFAGRPGEHFFFLNQNQKHPILETEEFNDENFSVLLPTALHAGVLFQINRIKFTGDFSLGFTNNAFNTTRFITYMGAEIRILPYLPIRAGTRIGHQLPGYYSFGGGFESHYFDINLAFQLRSKSSGPTNELSGLSVAAIKFYIP
ncbi:MAG: DUF5723 family protein, partial [Balneolaceae bacterium]